MSRIMINDIPRLFGINSDMSFLRINTGHINGTFLAECGNDKYILQSLNRNVFRYPENTEYNISAVVKAFKNSGQDIISVPEFLFSDGHCFLYSGGECFRMYRYIESAGNISPYETGLAYGTFIKIMSSGDIRLKKTIDGFHCYENYISRLKKIAPDMPETKKLIAIGQDIRNIFYGLPERNIHGDAKPDNLIINKNISVIDLDTAMNSYTALDFGDIVRSVCTGNFNADVFSGICRGFSDGLDGLLTQAEVNSLYYGILWITAELAIRYFIDGISKEGYFKWKTPEQCLERAGSLMKQLDCFISHKTDINNIIHKYL